MRCARSKIVTVPRGLPMLNACPTALRVLEAGEHAAHHVGHVRPGADLRAVAVDRQVAAGDRVLDERADRAAADLARAEDVERMHRDGREPELVVVGVRHVLAGELRDGVRPARLADGADRRDLPFGRRSARASRRPRSSRSRRSARASAASRSPPRARCTCRSRSRASRARGSGARCRHRRSPRSGRSASRRPRPRATRPASRMSPWTSVKFGWSPRSVPESASRWRLS